MVVIKNKHIQQINTLKHLNNLNCEDKRKRWNITKFQYTWSIGLPQPVLTMSSLKQSCTFSRYDRPINNI